MRKLVSFLPTLFCGRCLPRRPNSPKRSWAMAGADGKPPTFHAPHLPAETPAS